MADLDDQLLEGGIDLSSEEHNTQISIENSMSFDLIENGQSNNVDSQASADSVSLICFYCVSYAFQLHSNIAVYLGLGSNQSSCTRNGRRS